MSTIFIIAVALLTALVDVLVLFHFQSNSESRTQINQINLNLPSRDVLRSANNEITTSKKHFKLIICVKTSRSHIDLRSVLRQSWIGAAKKLPMTKVMFLLGEAPLAENEDISRQIQEEARSNGDIVFLKGFTDDYRNLSSNTAATLKWLRSEADFTFDWMMRADDDVWINVDRIYSQLEAMPGTKILWGEVFYNAPVKRDGKWGHTKAEWRMDIYPPYTNGPAYLLTADVVYWIAEMLERNFLRVFHSAEDANVGVWLAGTNVRVVNDKSFVTKFSAALPQVPCEPMWNAVHRMRNTDQMLEWSRNWEKCGCMCSCDPVYLTTKLLPQDAVLPKVKD